MINIKGGFIMLSEKWNCVSRYLKNFFSGFNNLSFGKTKRIIIMITTLIIGFLNIIRIYDNTFWGDETFSLLLVKSDIAGLISGTANDVHPPLYYLILKVFYQVLGDRGWVFHLASLVPIFILLIFSATVIYKKLGFTVTMVFSLFAGLSQSSVVYNVEVRMYSWAVFFVFFSFYNVYKILTERKYKYWVLFTLFSLAAAYTHYYALIGVAFIYAGLLLTILIRKIHIFKIYFICCLATVLGYLPWLFILLKQFSSTSENYWIEDIPSLKYCLGYIYGFGNTGTILFLIAIITFAVLIIKQMEYKNLEKKEIDPEGKGLLLKLNIDTKEKMNLEMIWMLIGYFSILGTFLTGELVSYLIRPMFLPRYMFPVAPIGWMILGITISRFKFKKIVIIPILIMMCVSFGRDYSKTYKIDKAFDISNIKTVEYLDKNMSKENIIVTNVKYLHWAILDYYFPGSQHMLIDSMDWSQNKAGVIWLLYTGDMSIELENELKKDGYSYELEMPSTSLGLNSINIYKISHQ